MFSFFISIIVNIGMWFERFVIIVTSLHRDYLPSSWTMFSPTFVDIGIFIGTIGFFFVLFLLYARTFPVIAQAEVKTIMKSSGERYKTLRESGQSLVGTGADPRTSGGPVKMNIDGHYEAEPQELAEGEVVITDDAPGAEALTDRLGIFDPATQKADDLQVINGIGPKMEEKLNELGIYTYDQVSRITVAVHTQKQIS